jgi:hypothetical protein
VFNRKIGDIVTPMTGLNEIASALVASIQLQDALSREQRIAVSACIEQTIPFRPDPITPLYDRLVLLGLEGETLDTTMRRAVRLGNRDVENFADNDPAAFLDNTWKLLPESNPALHAPLVYTVRDYRIALQKMEGFLSKLPAERVFHAWKDEPKHEVYARHVARTTGNLELAGRYLRAKLYAIGVMEAIADVSGATCRWITMGAPKDPDAHRPRRIEQFLPPPIPPGDQQLHDLLARAGVGVELRHRTVADQRVPARCVRRDRDDEVSREHAHVLGGRPRTARVPDDAAAQGRRRHRARCGQHHRHAARSVVRAGRAPRGLTIARPA